MTEMLAAAPAGTLGHQRLIQILHQRTGKEATQPSGSGVFQTQREKLKARFNSQAVSSGGKLAAAPSRTGKRKHAPSTATSSPSMTTDNEKAVRKGGRKRWQPRHRQGIQVQKGEKRPLRLQKKWRASSLRRQQTRRACVW